MQVVLLKDYKPHNRVLKKGPELGVTNEVGVKLIVKGIARDVTKEYLGNILVKRKEKAEKIEQDKDKKSNKN